MGKFDAVKKKLDEDEAAERARQEQIKAHQEQHWRAEMEWNQKKLLAIDRILKPALNEMIRELGLRDIAISTPDAKFTVNMNLDHGRRFHFDGHSLVELTIRKAPVNGVERQKSGLLFAMNRNFLLYLFSGAQYAMRQTNEHPWTESGVIYRNGHSVDAVLEGEVSEAQVTEIRGKVDDALVEAMKKLTGA